MSPHAFQGVILELKPNFIFPDTCMVNWWVILIVLALATHRREVGSVAV